MKISKNFDMIYLNFLNYKFFCFISYSFIDHKEYFFNNDKSNSKEIKKLHDKFNNSRNKIKNILDKSRSKYTESNGSDTIHNLYKDENLREELIEFLNCYEINHFYFSCLTEKLNEFIDIDILLKSEWEELKSKIMKYTNVHTLSCLIMGSYDLYNKKSDNFNYNDYDKNILLWAFLLHDIGKFITFDNIDQDFYDFCW